VKFHHDIIYQKLLTSVDLFLSYSQNKIGHFFERQVIIDICAHYVTLTGSTDGWVQYIIQYSTVL